MHKILLLILAFSFNSAMAEGFGTRGGNDGKVPFGESASCTDLNHQIEVFVLCELGGGCLITDLCSGGLEPSKGHNSHF